MKKRAGEAGTGEGDVQQLERVLGHTFAQADLLTLALTHRSFVHDGGVTPAEDLGDPGLDNEQLEFVGDAVLGLLAAEGLCRRFPASREGELTRLRASVVSRKHLGEVGTRLELGRSAAIFANAMEALIAAVYLDGGLEAARHFVEAEVLGPAMPELQRSLGGEDGVSGAVGDHKSALQEMLQADGLGRPEYRLLSETGPAHRRMFQVEVSVVRAQGAAAKVPEGALAQAEGSSKKQAQQEAARLAVAKLAEVGMAPGRKHG
jgi:ribonuclease-3